MKVIKTAIIWGCSVCLAAAQQMPIFTDAIRLSDRVNSEADEVKPILNSDASIMYFTRSRHKENTGYGERPQNQDIWEALTDGAGDWKEAEHETTINDVWDNSIIGKGKEDHYFLLNTYQSARNLDYGIALSRKLAEHNWTAPEVIKVPKLKYDGSFYDFYITHDEQVLIISIKGEDSKGEEDLYVSKREGNNWGEPINLGSVINTKGFEMSPFLTEDKKYLYFSSNGRAGGMGDADVYVTQRLDDTWTNWSTPENLGKGINSSAMDCYFTMSDNGEFYFCSNRAGSKGLDIYKANVQPPVVTVKGSVYNANDSTALPSTLSFMDKEGKNYLDNTDRTDYSLEVPYGQVFTLDAMKGGYEPSKVKIDMSKAKPGDVFVQNVYLKPIEKKEEIVVTETKPIVLKTVLHPYDQATHTDGTRINLDDVIKVMKDYPYMVIQIESHTDSKGSEEYNMELSKRRASGAKTYLIERGISGSRIKVKWYGESMGVAPNEKPDGSDNPEGRAQNRRTEFKIISNERK